MNKKCTKPRRESKTVTYLEKCGRVMEESNEIERSYIADFSIKINLFHIYIYISKFIFNS